MSLQDDMNDVRTKVKEIEEQNDLYRILNIYDKINKRLCIIIVALIILLTSALVYNVYITSDIGTIETTQDIDQNNTSGDNEFIGNDGNIINGTSTH